MPSALFKLDMFEGPLDLLLHLINKHKLNIYDIEIAVLLDQYLEYMENLDHEDYEDAADFLEMAARLVYIKTVSLLPVENEGEALKKELEGSLIEYSLCKMAAARLRDNYIGGDIFVRAPVKLPVNKTFTGEKEPVTLLEAYLGIGEKAKDIKPLRAEIFKPIVARKIVSVMSKIIFVLKKLFIEGECDLQRLYDGSQSKSERVAVFLAVLELTRSGRIFLNDDNTRVFMNSAAKKKRIHSDFDETEDRAAEAESPEAGNFFEDGEDGEDGEKTENAEADTETVPEESAGEDTEEDTEEQPAPEDRPAVSLVKKTGYRAEKRLSDSIRVFKAVLPEDISAEEKTVPPAEEEQASKTADESGEILKLSAPRVRRNFFGLRYYWGMCPAGRGWRFGQRL